MLLIISVVGFVAVGRSYAAIYANAVLSGASPVKGTIYFTQENDGQPLIITGHLRNLSPGDHGFHIHEYGNLTSGCASAGAHHNPDSKEHGAPSDGDRHVGDLGNIRVDNNGNVRINLTDARISLQGANSIIGRSVMVHDKKDDLGKGGDAESKKTGNAGGRLACGVVGLSPSGPDDRDLFDLSLKVFRNQLTK